MKPAKTRKISRRFPNHLSTPTYINIKTQVVICEAVKLDSVIAGVGKLVVARVPPVGVEERGSTSSRVEALREIRFLANLLDPNIARVFGICAGEPGPWTILEYTELGDLAHYLQYSVPLTGTMRPSCSLKALR